jgi:hypothetical protein
VAWALALVVLVLFIVLVVWEVSRGTQARPAGVFMGWCLRVSDASSVIVKELRKAERDREIRGRGKTQSDSNVGPYCASVRKLN